MIAEEFTPARNSTGGFHMVGSKQCASEGERVAILSDGGTITPEIDWAARFEARSINVGTIAKRACSSGLRHRTQKTGLVNENPNRTTHLTAATYFRSD